MSRSIHAPAGDYTDATGHDHPSQTEHAHTVHEQLHGESDKRLRASAPIVPQTPQRGDSRNRNSGVS